MTYVSRKAIKDAWFIGWCGRINRSRQSIRNIGSLYNCVCSLRCTLICKLNLHFSVVNTDIPDKYPLAL